MTRGFSEVVFTLVDVRIAAYNILADTFGTAIVVPEPQTYEVTPEADNDSIKATGKLTHLLSVLTHVSFKMSTAGIPFEALAIMSGASTNSSPTTQKTSKQSAGGAGMPYFGIVGKLVGEQGDDLHLGLPVCKLDKSPGWKAEQNKFLIGECAGKAIARESSGFAIYVLGHQTAAAIDFAEIFA